VIFISVAVPLWETFKLLKQRLTMQWLKENEKFFLSHVSVKRSNTQQYRDGVLTLSYLTPSFPLCGNSSLTVRRKKEEVEGTSLLVQGKN
jgi:hypothetical protein